MSIRPMLAAKFDEAIVAAHLRADGFLWMQPKIDGMRVLLGPFGQPLSRSGRVWTQRHLLTWYANNPNLVGLDGEMIAGHGNANDPAVFRASASGVRAEDGSPELTYYYFDNFGCGSASYSVRMSEEMLPNIYNLYTSDLHGYSVRMVRCPTYKVTSLEEIYARHEENLANNWEGSMLRRERPPYKHNRATALQGQLLKMKPTETTEAIIEGYEPWYQNNNEAKLSPLGFTGRSVHQENMVALDMLGAWHVSLLSNRDIKFKIGVMDGVTHDERRRLWANRDAYIGRIYEFRHQGYGGYDKPRTPVGLRFRSPMEF